MQTVYRVNDMEFTKLEDAREYEAKLTLVNAKFKSGDTVYFNDGVGLCKSVVTGVGVFAANTIMYQLEGLQCKKMEKSLYGTPDEYFEYLKAHVTDYSGKK